MSLYAFEHSEAYHVIFAFFFVMMAIMLILSCITLYRSMDKNIKNNVKKLNKVRYFTTFCIVIQYLTFIGYYIGSVALHESLWNVWIPAFTIALALLSYNIANIYLDTTNLFRKAIKKRKKKKKNHKVVWSKNEQENKHIQKRLETSDKDDDDTEYSADFWETSYSNTGTATSASDIVSLSRLESFSLTTKILFESKIQPLFWKCIWVLWISCAVSNWLGSITGWIFGILLAQAFFYMLWKFIAFMMLILCNYVLFIVKARLECVLKKCENKSKSSKKFNHNLISGRQRLKNLIICELILQILLFISVIYEIYVIISIASGTLVTNIYAESTIMSMFAYFPVWSTIHIVLLVYCWISKPILKKQKDTKDNMDKIVKLSNSTKNNDKTDDNNDVDIENQIR